MIEFLSKWSPFLLMPENVSVHGVYIDALIVLLHIVMLIIFLGWGTYFVYALIRFSRKNNQKKVKPVTGKIAKKVEIAIVATEIALLVFLSIPIWSKYIANMPEGDDVMKVRIVAQQFAWNIHYPGEDGEFGLTDPELVDTLENPIGIDYDDPNAYDDIVTIGDFYFPIHRDVVIELSSMDVIHSLFVPELRIKQDTIPGMQIPVTFYAKKEGEFEIACAQLCGIGHYRMRGRAFAVSEEEFDEWLEENADSDDEEGW